MPDWVRQSVVSSCSPSARARTAWLAPLSSTVTATIEDYLRSNPDGTDVTLAVLKAVKREDLDRLGGGRSTRRAKQDLGLFVAQSLVDLYGAHRVSTWRTGRRSTTRSFRDPGLPWVSSYTPHRVESP